MPFIRSLASKRYAYTIASIILLSGLMSFYSYYTEKGLVCVVIINSFTHQPSSCSECIKLNIYLSCDICSVSNAKYTFYAYWTSF